MSYSHAFGEHFTFLTPQKCSLSLGVHTVFYWIVGKVKKKGMDRDLGNKIVIDVEIKMKKKGCRRHVWCNQKSQASRKQMTIQQDVSMLQKLMGTVGVL